MHILIYNSFNQIRTIKLKEKELNNSIILKKKKKTTTQNKTTKAWEKTQISNIKNKGTKQNKTKETCAFTCTFP